MPKKVYGLERIFYIRPTDKKPTSDVKIFDTEEEREAFFTRYVNRKFSKVFEVKFFDALISNEKTVNMEDVEYEKQIKKMAETLGISYQMAKDFREGNLVVLPKDKFERIVPKETNDSKKEND